MAENIHVSVAWPYANGDLHVGHLAGRLSAGRHLRPLPPPEGQSRADGLRLGLARHADHGRGRQAQGSRPRQLFEHYHARFLETQQAIGISYDLFTHTDTENHHRIAQDFFLQLLDNGLSLKRRHAAPAVLRRSKDVSLPDRYVEGTCPVCGYDEARGDQCDNCGTLLDAVELINPRSKIDGSRRRWSARPSTIFLDLAAFADRLLRLSVRGTHSLAPQRHQLRPQLRRRWAARPADHARHRMGHTGPAGGLGGQAAVRLVRGGDGLPHRQRRVGQPTPASPTPGRTGGTTRQARIYNFLGKDNIPFHTVIWQAELMGVERTGERGRDPGLQPALRRARQRVHEHRRGEVQQEPQLGDLAARHPGTLRPRCNPLLRHGLMPETRDTDFSWEEFVRRNNDELVAAWGNLVNRVLSFAYKHWEGVVPTPGELRPMDLEILQQVEAGFRDRRQSHRSRATARGLESGLRPGARHQWLPRPGAVVLRHQTGSAGRRHHRLHCPAGYRFPQGAACPLPAAQLPTTARSAWLR